MLELTYVCRTRACDPPSLPVHLVSSKALLEWGRKVEDAIPSTYVVQTSRFKPAEEPKSDRAVQLPGTVVNHV